MTEAQQIYVELIKWRDETSHSLLARERCFHPPFRPPRLALRPPDVTRVFAPADQTRLLLHHVPPQTKRGPSLLTRRWPAFPPSSPLSFHKHQLPQDRKSPLRQGQQPQELQDMKVCREEAGGHADCGSQDGERPQQGTPSSEEARGSSSSPQLPGYGTKELMFEPPSLSLPDCS